MRLVAAEAIVIRTVSYFDNAEVHIAVARRSRERQFFLGLRAAVQDAVHACAFESGLARAIVGSVNLRLYVASITTAGLYGT
jgi:hypothetical protein